MTGIPVFREGQNFVIPSGHWSVVEACSGIRYLIASLTVGTLYAYLTYTSLKRRLLFILVSILVPIVANWLRAYMIVMLGHFSGNKLAVGVDHLIYGWVFFGVVILLMFAIGSRWAEPPIEFTFSPPTGIATAKLATVPWTAVVLLLTLLAAGPVLKHSLDNQAANTDIKLEAPNGSGGWEIAQPRLAWRPSYAEPSARISANYAKPDRWVAVDILYFQNQNFDRKLVSSTNVLVRSNDPAWQAVGPNHVAAAHQGDLTSLRESQLIDKIDSRRYVVWQWYWINGQLTSSDIVAKWLTAMNMLLGKGDDSAVIFLVAPQDEAGQSLPEFSRDMLPALYSALAQANRP
jgi:EpsI family protein